MKPAEAIRTARAYLLGMQGDPLAQKAREALFEAERCVVDLDRLIDAAENLRRRVAPAAARTTDVESALFVLDEVAYRATWDRDFVRLTIDAREAWAMTRMLRLLDFISDTDLKGQEA